MPVHTQPSLPTSSSHHFFFPQIKSSVNSKKAKYVLQGDSVGKVFQVDSETGTVSAFERLDREKVSEYHLVALIVDKDTNKDLESPSSFTIKVDDVNDNWPVFSRRLFNASVPEMSAVGMCVALSCQLLHDLSSGVRGLRTIVCVACVATLCKVKETLIPTN